jgi:hypothetical protein
MTSSVSVPGEVSAVSRTMRILYEGVDANVVWYTKSRLDLLVQVATACEPVQTKLVLIQCCNQKPLVDLHANTIQLRLSRYSSRYSSEYSSEYSPEYPWILLRLLARLESSITSHIHIYARQRVIRTCSTLANIDLGPSDTNWYKYWRNFTTTSAYYYPLLGWSRLTVLELHCLLEQMRRKRRVVFRRKARKLYSLVIIAVLRKQPSCTTMD